VKSFNELFEIINSALINVKGIGELYVYDTSLRIGAKLNVLPEKVYMHAGTRIGARRLGYEGSIRFIEISDLPIEFQQLEPYEIEDMLCRFKDKIAGE